MILLYMIQYISAHLYCIILLLGILFSLLVVPSLDWRHFVLYSITLLGITRLSREFVSMRRLCVPSKH